MAIILVSQGVPLHPDHEVDLRAIQARADELRFNAGHLERRGQTIQAKEARSMANVLECLIEPRSTSSDPMGAVADALRDQTEARAEDDDHDLPLVRMAKAIGACDGYRRHE